MTNKTPNKTKTPVGGLILGSDPIEFNAGRKTITLKVRNTGDRPIQSAPIFISLRSTGASLLTGKRRTVITSIFLPELRSVLSRARKKRCSSSRWAAENVSSV